MVSLDYDDVTEFWIKKEALRLRQKTGLPLDIYRSSEKHYHIRFTTPINKFEWGRAILKISNCSQAYKDLCFRMKMFPIRETKKKMWDADGNYSEKPKPIKILSLK